MERKWWTLLAVCVATFMLLLDVTVVNVALPDIQRDLDASFSSLQWVVDAYALTLAAFLLVAGSLGDRLGRRRVFTLRLRAVHRSPRSLCGLAGDPTAAQPRPRPPGRRRGGDVRDLAGADRPGVRGPRARQRDRRLGRDGRRRGGDRPAGRRPDHRGPRLGVDLLRQRPDRDRRDRAHRDASSPTSRRPTRSRSTGPGWSPSRPASSCSSSA